MARLARLRLKPRSPGAKQPQDRYPALADFIAALKLVQSEVRYLGLELPCPIVASSSPLTGELSSFSHHTAGYPDFTTWPAAPFSSTHQAQYYRWLERAYLGGLLEHTLNAIEVADAVCRFYPGLNRDLVIAASHSGTMVGINLRTGTPSPTRLRRAVRSALTDPRYRIEAARLLDPLGIVGDAPC